jgi:hypothetical protein
MLTQDAIDAFNTRLTVNLNNIKTMTASELDRVKAHGSTAEALLKNRDLALFIHQHKFDVVDQLTQITGHSVDDNSRRIAFSNQLAGTIAAGRCEGMVVLASSMFSNGKQAAGLSKQEVDASILYWWASQILPSVTAASESTKQLTPTELLPLIQNGISNASSSTLGLYYQGLGHTLLPIRQVQNGNVVTVDVYDSNTPLIAQQVLINTAKNTWSYTAVDATGNVVMQWNGGGAGTLDVIAMAARQPQATSYFSQ